MSKSVFLLAIGVAGTVSIVSCRDTGGEDPTGSDADGDSDADSDGDSDGDADGDTAFQSCGTTNVNVSNVATRVMLVEDKSLSMNDNNKWTQAVDAVSGMVTDYENSIEFGLDLFSIGDGGGGMQASCEVGAAVAEDVSLGNAADIMGQLQGTGPSGATPLLLEMQNFLDASYAPAFSAEGANRYLVVVSDGMDTCGQEGVFNQNGGASSNELASAAQQLADLGIGTIVIGFGDGANPDQLNAIAAAGGTVFDTYIDAQDGDALDAALNDIASTVVVSCLFKLNNYDPETVNTDRVNVLFDGTPVPRDNGCAKGEGWTWADDERTTIQFCEGACTQIENDSVDSIQIQIACSDSDVVVV